MKRSKFSDEQVLAIVKEARPAGRSPTCVARMGSPSRPTAAGRPSTAASSVSFPDRSTLEGRLLRVRSGHAEVETVRPRSSRC